jgi:hypothetical protein
MGFLDSLINLVWDANKSLDDLFTGSRISTDPTALGNGYSSFTAARPSLKPFIVGLIPPDIDVNFKPIDQINQRLSIPGKSTANNQSVSAGTSRGGGRAQLQPKRTKFDCQNLGDSICRSLKQRGYDDATVNRIAPLMVGQICTETGVKGNQFSCQNYNMGNVHAGPGGQYNVPGDPSSGIKPGSLTPPRGGQYILGYDTTASGQKYPVYFQASNTLDDATGKWVDTLIDKWPGVIDAQDASGYTKALRPDLYGGHGGAYFVSSPQAYERGIESGSGRYQVTTVSSQGGVEYSNLEGTIGGPPEASYGPPGVDIMTTGNITDMESDDPLNNTGRNIRITTDNERLNIVAAQVAQVNSQIIAAWSIPPLGMIINPSDFTRSYEHTIDAPKVRRGHIIHLWLEKPLSISCKGVTAAQYIISSTGDGGLTNRFRAQSLSYLNLMSLVRIYKNNGYIYSGDSFGELNSNIPLIAMSVYIYYDGHIYLGSFDDFSISDNADKPFNLEYSFKFTCRYDMDVTSITDNQIVGLEGF